MIPYTAGFRVIDPRGEFLAGRGANETSQFGEDGLIEAALQRFGAANQWCFEVGASDGVYLSNTFRLRKSGWRALLIEEDEKSYDELRRFSGPLVRTVHQRIGSDSLDGLLEASGAPRDIDFGVIDIDGQDYWIWNGLRRHRPRLQLVEFHFWTDRSNGTDLSESLRDCVPELNGEGQATFQAILRLGKEKGYVPLAKTTCNVLFAAEEILS